MSLRLHEVTIDCADVRSAAAFWSALLGVCSSEPMPGWQRLPPPHPGAPMINLQPVSEPKQGKSRVHLDLLADDLGAELERIAALGGRTTGERHDYPAGTVVVCADPEGTEFCVVAYR